MDCPRLYEAIRSSERLVIDQGDCAGLPLGMVFEAWPDMVLTNRVLAGRQRGESHKTIKAYCKFAKAADEFVQAWTALQSAGGAPHVDPGKTPGGAQGAQAPARQRRMSTPANLRIRALPVANAIVPFDAQEAQRPLIDDVQTGMQPVPLPAGPQNTQRTGRLPKLFTPVSALRDVVQHRVYDPAQHPGGGWRPCLSWILGLAITLLVPRLVFRLVTVLIEKIATASVFAAVNVATAATTEAEEAGNRFVSFVEQTLDICIADAPHLSVGTNEPPDVATVAQLAASTAASAIAHVRDRNLSADDVSKLVEQTVATVLTSQKASTMDRVRAVATEGWKMPGWIILLAGGLITRMGQHAPAGPR